MVAFQLRTSKLHRSYATHVFNTFFFFFIWVIYIFSARRLPQSQPVAGGCQPCQPPHAAIRLPITRAQDRTAGGYRSIYRHKTGLRLVRGQYIGSRQDCGWLQVNIGMYSYSTVGPRQGNGLLIFNRKNICTRIWNRNKYDKNVVMQQCLRIIWKIKVTNV